MELIVFGQMLNINMQVDCSGWCPYDPDDNCWDK